ncbi:MAG: TetR/AcrR family transcriptional regulator [Panacagrimonas sp.]
MARTRAARMGREERTAEILAVAREHFCAQGYQGAAVSEIAKQSGVSEATVFKYFPSKLELLNRVVEHWYGELFGDYTADLAMIGGARNRLRYLTWRHLKTIQQWPHMCRLIFTELRAQPGYAKSPLHVMNSRYTGLFLEVLSEGVEAGEFRADVPRELIRDLVYGGIEHHSWGVVYGRATMDAESIADQLTELVCQGISTEQAQAQNAPTQQLPELVRRLESVVARLKDRI